MIGHRPFCARILSQHTSKGRLDWRLAYDEIRIEAMDTPREVEAFCRELLERLGLVFGCFDFVVQPDGEPVFLEVNQQGQFLFVEQATGQPLLDAFSELLLQGSPDFRWQLERVRVRYEDIRGVAEDLARESLRSHLPMQTPRDRQPLETHQSA